MYNGGVEVPGICWNGCTNVVPIRGVPFVLFDVATETRLLPLTDREGW